MKAVKTNVKPFGLSAAGEPVFVIALSNGILSCEVLTYGATLRTLLVPDHAGARRDVVLGYDTLQEYETQDGYLGATIGRFANRISKGQFSINETTYSVATNDGQNHHHGGICGFSHRVWTIEEVHFDRVTLSLLSKNADEGYPGNLRVRVTYALVGAALSIHYEAVSDADTICSLTNHSYFNLEGHNSGVATAQKVLIEASHYTPSAADNIPLGWISPVEGTPMDLRTLTRLDAHIEDDFVQLTQARGYDHNYVINGGHGVLRNAATALSDVSGIMMRVETTLPGMHLYTANFLTSRRGKENSVYDKRHAFCLETQFFPDTPNQPSFPSAVLKAAELYDHTTVFTFIPHKN